MYKMNYAWMCIKGAVRPDNQDNIWNGQECLPQIHSQDIIDGSGTIDQKSGGRLAVFDGMGGYASGEIASFLAADSFGKTTETVPERICRDMNQIVLNYGKIHRSRNMGTTVAALICEQDRIICFNIGDSRCYHYSERELKQVSVDHTVKSPVTGLKQLTQVIGIPEEEFLLEPEVRGIPYREGDIFLLCSDGLWGLLSDEEISTILSHHTALQEMLDQFRMAVVQRGATDNVTVILGRIQ